MSDDTKNQLNQALTTAFIDASVDSNLALKPRFLTNRPEQGQKVLSTIEDELLRCNEFSISVAFITMGGIAPLLQSFRELERRGIKGRILTTDYLNFSDPQALLKLHELSNIEIRMFRVKDGGKGFHTKGYIFREEETYKIIIGSSNMTLTALTVNHEWNTKIVSTTQGEMTHEIVSEFERLWRSKDTKPFELFYEDYRTRYEAIAKQRKVAAEEQVIPLDVARLEPNKMQVGFINNLKKLIAQGENKALLISATGTGKTYASAFGIRDAICPEGKVLFVVHRKEILKQAYKSYQRVFGRQVKMAILSGDDKDYDRIKEADFVFAMVAMINKPEVYEHFSRNEFSVLCIDETHHSTAASYRRILGYFTPSFLLGMTATPDRTDGENIYDLFDHNIAYEIRLQQALEHDLLCPFHYFGITDIAFDINESGDDLMRRLEKGDMTVFNLLTRDERVDYVIEQANYYGYSGNRVKGLIFCSTIKEAKALSEKFNARGLRTLALTGEDNSDSRMDAIERLTDDTRVDRLDYILTVDIFNEGVDIPEINQVIMLRPTESAIIFVQQLGRGLRKSDEKEYVIILDFIGNFSNNFLIPIALSGDRTYNKDNLRKYLLEGSSVIPGSSSIHFDEISKKKIFESIDKANTPLKFLKEKYFILRDRLGRMPTVLEFYQYGEIDPILFVDYLKESYYEFVRKIDVGASVPEFSAEQKLALNYVSTQLANGKRIHELEMLQLLIDTHRVDFERLSARMKKYDLVLRRRDYDSAVRVLNKEFINAPGEKATYGSSRIVEKDGDALVEAAVLDCDPDSFFMNAMRDIVAYGLARYEDYYSESDEDNLVLYQKYSRKDICRILDWDKDDSSTVYGYRIKHGTCPIFVTYEKRDDISDTTKYEDRFVDDQMFSWMTRSRVSVDSPEAQEIINYQKNDLKIYLFVKKSDGEGTDFYYMGQVTPVAYEQTTIADSSGKMLPIMNFKLKLHTPIRNDIYEYFTK